jgi:group I intron endonuclease
MDLVRKGWGEMTYGIIYKATGPDGKVYIGKTVKTLARRKSGHIFQAKKGDRRTPFLRAILEEGIESFTWEQIDTADTPEKLDAKEKQWIAHYDSMNPEKGYNNQEGGINTTYSPEACKRISEAKKGHITSIETRKKISEAHKGKHHTPETRRKMSEVQKGRHHTEESRRKMSEARKGRKMPPFTEEHRRKLSESHKGKKRPPPSDEWRRKQSEAHKGKSPGIKGSAWQIGDLRELDFNTEEEV